MASHPSRGWSDTVDQEAHRTFVNWIGRAIGASQHQTIQAALAAVLELSPAAQASILGRKERVDTANAAMLNGISSHTFDFDDTHLKTIIHPAGPVASAALGQHLRIGGRELIDALVLGIEVSCRVGNAIYADHYDRGWHITGSPLPDAPWKPREGCCRSDLSDKADWTEIVGRLGEILGLATEPPRPATCLLRQFRESRRHRAAWWHHGRFRR